MAYEIERKFLIKDLAFLANEKGTKIAQGYLSVTPERTVRVRIYGDKGYLCIKTPAVQGVRHEFEYEIPLQDAQFMLQNIVINYPIEKERYCIFYDGLLWEVDVFYGKNQGLCTAEIELPSIDTAINLPPWIDKEITHEIAYLNSQLCVHPYSFW